MLNSKMSLVKRQRFEAIEIIAYWEGKINTTQLTKLFNVTVSNITKDLADYRRSHPDSLIYNSSIKAYEPSNGFHPRYISTEWKIYHQFLLNNESTYKQDFWHPSSLDSIPLDLYVADKSVMRTLTTAIKLKQSLTIKYRSFSNPKGITRIIHPHAIAFNGLRWHCRAFDEHRREYRDFNIGRIEKVSFKEFSQQSHLEDKLWHKFITFKVDANNLFTPEQKALVLKDYGHKQPFTLKARAALAQYVINHYNISLDTSKDNPMLKQLMLTNIEQCRKYLFQS